MSIEPKISKRHQCFNCLFTFVVFSPLEECRSNPAIGGVCLSPTLVGPTLPCSHVGLRLLGELFSAARRG